jgi:hypothetical protein
VFIAARESSEIRTSSAASGPGKTSAPIQPASPGDAARARAARTPATSMRSSCPSGSVNQRGSIAGGSSGSGERSHSRPRLRGRATFGVIVIASAGVGKPSRSLCTANVMSGRCMWMSCASAPGSLRRSTHASQSVAPSGGRGRRASHMTSASAWSHRFSPTPGRLRSTGIPAARSASPGPMPESMSRRGVSMAPQATTSSRRAVTTPSEPSLRR